MAASAALRIRFVGIEKTLAALKAMPQRVDAAQGEGLSEAAVYLKGRVMQNLSGRAGFPQSREGNLARGTVAEQARRGGAGWYSRVGTGAIVAYGRILEFGGPIPEHEVFAGALTGRSGKQCLSWPASTTARAKFFSHLGDRRTPREAQRRAGEPTGWAGFAHAMHLTIPARIQRAIPYLRPTLEEEMPKVTAILRRHLARALKGGA